MAFVTVDGIRTRYEVLGSGPPLLLFSPGGFNATIENWRSFGIYARLSLLVRRNWKRSSAALSATPGSG